MTTEINNIQYRDDCVKWTWVTALLYVAPDQTDTVLYLYSQSILFYF